MKKQFKIVILGNKKNSIKVMTIIAKGEEILQYIPQRYPMVMIDTLSQVDESVSKTGLEIKSDNIFIVEHELSASGLVENIAQSAAASAGYYFISNNEEVKTGFASLQSKHKVFK